MSDSQNVLASLHDIHLPAAISWWPLAPGWYALLILVLFVIGWLIYFVRRNFLNRLAKKEALQWLKTYEKAYQRDRNSQLSSMQVSELLRRVALVYFAREEVASLKGEAWLTFLSRTSTDIDFNEYRQYFLEIPYQPANDVDLQPLFHCATAWIKQRKGAPCSN